MGKEWIELIESLIEISWLIEISSVSISPESSFYLSSFPKETFTRYIFYLFFSVHPNAFTAYIMDFITTLMSSTDS